MFNALVNRLRGHRPDRPLPELDAQLAVGALLVRLAKSDDDYSFAEIVEIDRLLAARFALSQVDAMKMRADCERLAAQAPDTDEFAALVHGAVPYEERVGLIEALWRLSLADRRVSQEEGRLIAALAHGFGINPDDSSTIAARFRG